MKLPNALPGWHSILGLGDGNRKPAPLKPVSIVCIVL